MDAARLRALARVLPDGSFTPIDGRAPDLSGLDGPSVVALSDGRAIGALVASPYATGSGSAALDLVLVWVAPTWRGRHLARSLLAALVDNSGAATMRATIPPGADIEPVTALLRGAGFEPNATGTWSVRHVRRTYGRANLTHAR